MDELKELTGIEQTLCDIMQSTPLYLPQGVVPTQAQLEELRKHADQLSTEKVDSGEAGKIRWLCLSQKINWLCLFQYNSLVVFVTE